MLLKGEYKMKAHKAPEPSNILWENLEVKKCESCWRSFVVILVVLLCLAVSFVIIYLIRVYQNSLPKLDNCD